MRNEETGNGQRMTGHGKRRRFRAEKPMVSVERFRQMALAMDGAIEGAHMGHPDFRVRGRIFATLTPDRAARRGMVQLTPGQQQEFVAGHPTAFVPASGAWGRNGSTMVVLKEADEEVVGEAMTLAWQNAMERGPVRGVKRAAHAKTARSRTNR